MLVLMARHVGGGSCLGGSHLSTDLTEHAIVKGNQHDQG